MRPFKQLPRTAVIVQTVPEFRLVIKNHRVINPSGFLHWLLGPNNHPDYSWDDIQDQLIKQGIEYGTFVETCQTELQDEYKRYRIFYLFAGHDPDQTLRNVTSGVRGKIIVDKIMGMLRACENWDRFHDKMKWCGNFHTEIKEEILGGMNSCIR